MQAGRVLLRTRHLSPRRKTAWPAPRNRIAEADDAALLAVPSGAATPRTIPSGIGNSSFCSASSSPN